MPPRVSLVMIVRNEAAALPACLGSVAGLVDEIVVVDTGSTDDTKGVAGGFGARVLDFAWTDDFSAARNESLRHATGEWVMWLDADERVSPTAAAKVRGLVGESPRGLVGYVFSQHSPTQFLDGGAAGESGEQVARQVRLFRNDPRVRWEGRVFEQIRGSIRRAGGEVRQTDIVIDHDGYRTAEGMARRVERNLRLIRLQLADTPDDPFAQAELADLLCAAGRTAEAIPVLLGCRDRLPPASGHAARVRALLRKFGTGFR